MPAMHVITGCDTVSSFYGIGKAVGFDRLVKNTHLLNSFGYTLDITDETMKYAEQFVALCYSQKHLFTDINKCRYNMFSKSQKQNIGLPPCQSTLHLHLTRANYQAYIWKHCLNAEPALDSPTKHGWDESMMPILTNGLPAPRQLLELHICGCKLDCKRNCGCKKNKLKCVSACGCGPETCDTEIISDIED